LIDVREPHEWQIGRIEGATLIPMNDVPKRLGELDPNAEIVVHCKMGGRSAKVVEFLKANGYHKARNMAGGILAWSEKVDPSVPKY
jgi:rhodanese-related sulfurtransferase